MERTARDFKGIWIDREIWLSEERIKDLSLYAWRKDRDLVVFRLY